ncbi:MAG TPA: ureidoglycolate lyase [Xanthobacteraceae bacterium]|nr:ureidoglycolate lyase [Xanthobacteraceae bacterium]
MSQSETASQTIIVAPEPLTAEAFAPFGSVAGRDLAKGLSVNQGRALRVPGIRDLAHDGAAPRPVLDLYRIAPSQLPFRLACLERHPLTSQAFIPAEGGRLLVIVAPDDATGQPDLVRLRAFIAPAGTVIHYRAGAWHSPLIALDAPAVLAMLMWECGDRRDCEEFFPAASITIAAADRT